MKTNDDFELKIAYNNNPKDRACSPPAGTRLHVYYDVHEDGELLKDVARSVVYSLKNKYFLERLDEKE